MKWDSDDSSEERKRAQALKEGVQATTSIFDSLLAQKKTDCPPISDDSKVEKHFTDSEEEDEEKPAIKTWLNKLVNDTDKFDEAEEENKDLMLEEVVRILSLGTRGDHPAGCHDQGLHCIENRVQDKIQMLFTQMQLGMHVNLYVFHLGYV